MDEQFITGVAQALPKYKHWQVKAALTLLDEGNTIPFIARYRKEQTGVLDEVALQEIQETAHRQSELAARKATVLKAISAAGKLSPALEAKITAAPDLAAAVFARIPKIARAIKASDPAIEGMNILNNNGEVAYQSVFHSHFHLIPRYQDDDFRIQFVNKQEQYDDAKYQAVLDKITKQL